MKNVKLTFVLMAGLPGTGKSRLAFKLGEELGWSVIDKDKFKDEFLKEGYNAEAASNKAYKESFKTAKNELIKRRSVILDSAALDPLTIKNAKKTVKSVEKRIQSEEGIQIEIQIKAILCYASSELRKERVQARKSHDRFSPISHTRADPSTMEGYLQLFKHLPPPPDRLVLNTKDPLVECLLRARDYLVRGYKDLNTSVETR